MQKKYFTPEEKNEAKKRWRKKDYYKHHEQRLKEMKERHQKNKERYNEQKRKKYQIKKQNPIFRQKENERHALYHEKNRKLCINHYSKGKNCCELCRENNIDTLTIDHINGGGTQHRKKTKIYHIAEYLKKNNYPDGYRVLCMNCNMKEAKKQKLYGTKQFIQK